MLRSLPITMILFVLCFSACSVDDKKPPLIVFVVGDHEYSSEITMPRLAAELEDKYGFQTKVLNAHPDHNSEENIPGLEELEKADLAIFFLRWRRLPEEQLNYIQSYLESNRPLMGFRTTTHAFNYADGHPLEKWNAFGEFAFNAPPGWEKKGHTHYGHESTTEVRKVIDNRNHPVLDGISLGFSAKSWLYTLYPDYPSEGSTSLLMGKAINPDDIKAIDHPVAWVGKNSFGTNFFMTTLGHPEDFEEEDFQKLIINAIHWLLSKEEVKFAGKADIAVTYDTHPNL